MSFVFSPLPHEAAVARIAGLPLVSRDVMEGLLPELRAYAFTIAGLDVGDTMSRIRDTIKAVPAGALNWDKARKEIAADLDDALGGKVAQRRAELLLRTHVFRGYAAARYRNLIAQTDVFPYWQYKTVGDERVRPSHVALNGKIFPAGHVIWQRIFPPWDWGCRCLVVPLTQKAVERVLARGKLPDGDAAAALLLPAQNVRPEIFSAKEASLIAKNARLPNGIPLNRTPTWADSPWSAPGNVQHDWKLIRKRYADDPDTLKAFENWAKDTEIPGLNMTVDEWIGAEGSDTRRMVRAYKKRIFAPLDAELKKKSKGGESTFHQAMRKKSRYGLDVEFDDGEEDALRALVTAKGAQKFGAAPATPAAVENHAVKFEADVANDDHENAAAWSPDGAERERRRSRLKRKVSLFNDSLLGSHTSHNHPSGGPPSLEDIDVIMNPASRPLELRIVTREWLYRVVPGPRATADFRKLPGYDRAWNAATIVSDQLRASMDWTLDRTDQAVQHALLSWLAKQGVIHYERLPR